MSLRGFGHKPSKITTMLAALGISRSTIHQMYRQDKIIRSVRKSIKPFLTEINKMVRLLYAYNRIGGVRNNDKLFYKDCYNEVHVDEKWFFITEKDQHLYLTENEAPPQRQTQSKAFITKVMFYVQLPG
jgi:hypothetical protein